MTSADNGILISRGVAPSLVANRNRIMPMDANGN